MQVLRIVDIADDGTHLVCAAAGESTARYLLPIDERMRAAVRTRHWENQMTTQLRPREIQARIRAGASVEQVAAAAGCPAERIEPFAYPVLMERATVAERARAVRPLAGAPIGSTSAASAGSTLEEIALATLTDRGQGGEISWDAFRDERGWTLTLTWQAGRSENRAEWSYVPTVDGGAVTPRNAEAADLIEPAPSFLRSVDDARDIYDGARADTRPAEPHADRDEPSDAVPVGGTDVLFRTVEPITSRTGAAAPARPAKRGNRPAMPSWEDVLLGTRAAER